MARGGRRQGTPGTVYGQRTDLNPSRSLDTGYTPPAAPQSPAGGGGAVAPAPAGPPEAMGVHPDTVTPLFAPTDRPGEPVTAGLPYGPGPGPAGPQPNNDLLAMKRYLPLLLVASRKPDTPASVVSFVQFLQSQLP